MSASPLGVYLHVPFCRTRCRYCDFYRVGENAVRQTAFLGALGREIDGLTEFDQAPVDTVFLGGGTPSLLTPEQIADTLARLHRRFVVAPDAEITMEANPSDLSPERLAGYRAAGINRLSIGVQSLSDRELRLIGRRHDAARARDAVAWARGAGFDNLSIDLMLAIPGQTEASFAASLAGAVALAPDHLSVYLLEVHENSEIDFLRRERPRLFPGEEAQRRRYLRVRDRLRAAGFEHYEISNFCRQGKASRHNLKYWRCEPFLGLGPAAHSAVGERRWQHPADLAAYLIDPSAVVPAESDLVSERIFLGLRLAEGVAIEDARRAAGLDSAAFARRLEAYAPFVVLEGDRMRLTVEGFLVSTPVLAGLLAAS